MKYQIYLKKDTSNLVNQLAEKNGEKPATFIKKFLESFMRIYSATEDQLKKEIMNDYGDK